MYRFCKLAAIIALGFSLSACASGASIGAMTVTSVPDAVVKADAPIKQAIEIGKVDGGSETIPLWKSEVSTENFSKALMHSLKANNLLAQEKGRYILDATIIDIDQPILGGFDMEVTASVQYKLTNANTNAVVFDRKIVTPHVTNFSEAFIAVERLKLANEGAVRDNIQAFIKAVVNEAKLAK